VIMLKVSCEYRQCRCHRAVSRMLQCHMRESEESTRVGVQQTLWTDCTVERDCSNVGQSTSSAVALATVEVVGALVGPHTTVDGARDADCHANDGTDHHEGN
jgi:hypothetical protein